MNIEQMNIKDVEDVFSYMVEKYNHYAEELAQFPYENNRPLRDALENKRLRAGELIKGFRIAIQFAGLKIHLNYEDCTLYSKITSFDIDSTNSKL